MDNDKKLLSKARQCLLLNDMDFFEQYVINLSMEEQVRFWKENPCFLKEYGCSIESLDLLQDLNYRNLRRMMLELDREEDKYEQG